MSGEEREMTAQTASEAAREDDRLDATDRRILDVIQTDFPLAPRPYAVLGERLGLAEATAYELIGKGHFEVIDALGKRRITKESFERWYSSQSEYLTGSASSEHL